MQGADDQANPLLDLSGLPRFSAIRAEHVLPALGCVLSENRAAREQLLKISSPTWDNFVQPLEDMDERLSRMWSPASHLNAVRNTPALRQVFNDGQTWISEYRTELAQDERLYRCLKKIAEAAQSNGFEPPQRKILDNALRDFRLNGAQLDGARKQRFKEIQKQLASLSNRFQDNVLDATQAWELVLTDEADLAGLPQTAQLMARQTAQHDGKAGFKFTLDAPSYSAFMTFADNRALRARMYEAYVTRASDQGPDADRWDNSAIIVEILKLRREAARLLGFASYAEYSLQTKMVKNVGQVLDFLRDLATRAKAVAECELDELRKFARSEYGVEEFQAWDLAYYSEKLRQHRYHFSREDLRPYFPADQVIAGMFEVVFRLYGLSIKPVSGVDTWHPDVRFYEICDASGEARGRFYLDLYAREHKRSGAWMDECISRKRVSRGVQTPVAYLTCNCSPPLDERPALFSHDEVITLFHEFGHGLHHMLTQVDYVGVAGIHGVAWDAVELPSQFMENWCWQRVTLDLIGRHYQSAERIPQSLYTKLIDAKNFQSGMQMVRQLEFALFDAKLHSDYEPDGEQGVQDVLDETRREVAVLTPPSYNRFQNAFSHIFAGGYAAGYYSYKWAEVLSADAFSKFERNGIFDRRTGSEFLHSVLEQGGVREPLELFVAFRGRKPKIDALLRHSGLTQP